MACDRTADGHLVSSVCSASVVLDAHNIARASLHVIFEARDLFPNFSYLGAGGQNGSGSCFDMVRRLERWYRAGSKTNGLLPGRRDGPMAAPGSLVPGLVPGPGPGPSRLAPRAVHRHTPVLSCPVSSASWEY